MKNGLISTLVLILVFSFVSCKEDVIVPIDPTVTTGEALDVLVSSAVLGGEVLDEGSSAVTVRGVEYSTSNEFTEEESTMAIDTTGGLGSFTVEVIGLVPNTTYYYRSHAASADGFAYGETKSFSSTLELPTVTTGEALDILVSSAVLGGNVLNEGSSAVTVRGVEYSTSNEFNEEESTMTIATTGGLGSFTVEVIGLVPNTTYYYRSHAASADGFSYGETKSFTCAPELPSITTGIASYVSPSSAVLAGDITSEGSFAISARGVEYSTISNFTGGTGTEIAASTGGSGLFTVSATGLSEGTTYYYRTYAVNSEGYTYGDIMQFITKEVALTDIDNNTYGAVQIGEQVWMSENLKVTKYPNGDAIPNVTDNTDWINLADDYDSDAYCYYDNDVNSKYGVLYTVAAAIKACPTGWHLPSEEEWIVLTTFLTNNGHSGTEGDALKSTSGWDDYKGVSGNGTDDYGFSAFPNGFRDHDSGEFSTADNVVRFWSSTYWTSGSSTGYNYFRYLQSSNSTVRKAGGKMSAGTCIRCLKDE